MTRPFNYIVENCGNFSATVLPGMIAYGRESKKSDPGHIPNKELQPGDGYATREHDIQLGGFLYRECAKTAVRDGQHLADLSVEQKQRLALEVCRQHIQRHGEVGLENYKHWLKRAISYAKHHHLEIPRQDHSESQFQYFQRFKRWTQERPERWPEMHRGVGTHLVFSPDPKIWPELRERGVDERLFLKEVLAGTMKELHDWRRERHGPGHSLGWVAGTHVVQKGADRHPHIHVVVLKRDESGKETDWSVSALRGRAGRGQEPDPLAKVKQLFKKNSEKCFERYVGREPGVELEVRKEQTRESSYPHPATVQISRLSRVAFGDHHRHTATDLGALIRLCRLYRQSRGIRAGNYMKENLPTLSEFKSWVEKEFPRAKVRLRALHRESRDFGPER